MNQKEIEEHFSKKKPRQMIKQFILENIEDEDIDQAVALLEEWVSAEYYPSKQARLEKLAEMDLRKLVVDVVIRTTEIQQETLLTNVVGQLASLLDMKKLDSIKTMSEILAILSEMEWYELIKESNEASWMIVSLIEIPEEIQDAADRCLYMPPMIQKPRRLKDNKDSGYLTIKESLILGNGNHHDGDICLDVLNLMASVPLKLDVEFISEVVEERKEVVTADMVLQDYPELTDEEAIAEAAYRMEMHEVFAEQSQAVYDLIIDAGNEFYLNQKVDKRGRVYPQGYHVSTAGSSYKKASIELAHEEVVEGI